MHARTGRLDLAVETFRQALAICNEIGDRNTVGAHLCGLGLVYLQQGLAGQARRSWREGADTLRELNDGVQLDKLTGLMHEACAAAGVPTFD